MEETMQAETESHLSSERAATKAKLLLRGSI